MKKLALSFIVIAITTISAKSQGSEAKVSKSTHVNFGVNVGTPIGNTTSSLTDFVLGGDLQFVYNLGSKMDITGSAGVDVWHGKKAKNFNYVPVLGGLRLFISDKVFISEQAGYAIGLSKDPKTEMKIKGAFTNIAGIGFKITNLSDILLCYKGIFLSDGSKNAIALRLSYNFGAN